MFDEEEEEPIVSPDTENATHFHALEAPTEQQKKYKRFHGYNSGIYNGEWANKTKLRRLDDLALYDAISSQLDMTNYQKRRARQIFDGFDKSKVGYSSTLIAFVVCAYVCREDGRVYHPARSEDNNDDLFVEFSNELKETGDQIHAGYNRITERLP